MTHSYASTPEEQAHQTPEGAMAQEEAVQEGAAEEKSLEPALPEEDTPRLSPSENKESLEAQRWQERYLRRSADLDNYKKRVEKERVVWIANAGRRLLTDLLPVVDDLNRALAEGREENAPSATLLEGVTLIQQKLMKVCSQHGLTQIPVQVGDEVNLDEQEILTQVPAPREEQHGKVVEVVSPGYRLHGRLLRVAKVITGA